MAKNRDNDVCEREYSSTTNLLGPRFGHAQYARRCQLTLKVHERGVGPVLHDCTPHKDPCQPLHEAVHACLASISPFYIAPEQPSRPRKEPIRTTNGCLGTYHCQSYRSTTHFQDTNLGCTRHSLDKARNFQRHGRAHTTTAFPLMRTLRYDVTKERRTFACSTEVEHVFP